MIYKYSCTIKKRLERKDTYFVSYEEKMMKKHKLFRKRPSCPYCGKEIPYGQLLDFRKSSSCLCSSCKSIFKISYPPSSFRLVLWISAAALVVCILLALLFHGEVPIFLLPVILLVFFVLYFSIGSAMFV